MVGTVTLPAAADIALFALIETRGRIHGQNPLRTKAEFLDEIQTEVLRVFLLALHSHLPWDFYFFKLTQPLTVSTVRECTL